MKRFFQSIAYRFQSFMQGRYGTDELSYFLFIVGLVVLILSSLISPLSILYLPALALLIWAWFRSMSRNIDKRQRERGRYLRIRESIGRRFGLYRNMWRDRKTHRYYHCPSCKGIVRITRPPRGKCITIVCPHCRNSFQRRV